MAEMEFNQSQSPSKWFACALNNSFHHSGDSRMAAICLFLTNLIFYDNLKTRSGSLTFCLDNILSVNLRSKLLNFGKK